MTYPDMIPDRVNQRQQPAVDNDDTLLSEFNSLSDDVSHFISGNTTAANGCSTQDVAGGQALSSTAVIKNSVSLFGALDVLASVVVADIGMSLCSTSSSKKKSFKSSSKHISSGQLLTKNTFFKSATNDRNYKNMLNAKDKCVKKSQTVRLS